jgi:hypothetical protein
MAAMTTAVRLTRGRYRLFAAGSNAKTSVRGSNAFGRQLAEPLARPSRSRGRRTLAEKFGAASHHTGGIIGRQPKQVVDGSNTVRRNVIEQPPVPFGGVGRRVGVAFIR